jgi:hypothetical protein
MKGAKAFVACLVLALVAGRASAKRCSISKNAASSCSFYSGALNMQLTLTQACVKSNSGVIPSSSEYYQENQLWWGKPESTMKSFILEVYNNCNFGQPNLGGINTSPWACYSTKLNNHGGNTYVCAAINKKGKRTTRPSQPGLPSAIGLLSANN